MEKSCTAGWVGPEHKTSWLPFSHQPVSLRNIISGWRRNPAVTSLEAGARRAHQPGADAAVCRLQNGPVVFNPFPSQADRCRYFSAVFNMLGFSSIRSCIWKSPALWSSCRTRLLLFLTFLHSQSVREIGQERHRRALSVQPTLIEAFTIDSRPNHNLTCHSVCLCWGRKPDWSLYFLQGLFRGQTSQARAVILQHHLSHEHSCLRMSSSGTCTCSPLTHTLVFAAGWLHVDHSSRRFLTGGKRLVCAVSFLPDIRRSGSCESVRLGAQWRMAAPRRGQLLSLSHWMI